MLDTIADYLIRQRAGEREGRAFTNWDHIKSICIVAQKSDFFNQKILNDLLQKNNKTADIILFHPDKVSNNPDVFLSLNKKDLGFLSVPKQETIAKLRSKDYDILIDCNSSGTRVGKAIASSIKAKCKVGHKQLFYSSQFDLCLDFDNTPVFPDYLNHVFNYLKMIKTNK